MTLTTFGHTKSQLELREVDGGAFQLVRKLAPDTIMLLGTISVSELTFLHGMLCAALDMDTLRRGEDIVGNVLALYVGDET